MQVFQTTMQVCAHLWKSIQICLHISFSFSQKSMMVIKDPTITFDLSSKKLVNVTFKYDASLNKSEQVNTIHFFEYF